MITAKEEKVIDLRLDYMDAKWALAGLTAVLEMQNPTVPVDTRARDALSNLHLALYSRVG